MATKVEFIDPMRVRVTTSDGDSLILGYTDSMNYQIEQQWGNFYSRCVVGLFDKYYDGTSESLMGPILRGMYRNRLNPFFWVMPDRDSERVRMGNRIKELRKMQGMDAKTLAQKVGIDAGNLSRIEQGRFSVGFDTLSKIAAVLNMTIDFIPINQDNNYKETKL
ncbi:MAG: helix-turn-helix transcriptional regulator [Bacteroidales bacterium]|nr:helix-turn-helix transcriptional regulator [Bacteroidales bacterium]MBR4218800.1 helix-turn-helix transcriptional regulator [Bacteroidales bacterium]